MKRMKENLMFKPKAERNIKVGLVLLLVLIIFCLVDINSRPTVGTAQNINCAGCSQNLESRGLANGVGAFQGIMEPLTVLQIIVLPFIFAIPLWVGALFNRKAIGWGFCYYSLWLLLFVCMRCMTSIATNVENEFLKIILILGMTILEVIFVLFYARSFTSYVLKTFENLFETHKPNVILEDKVEKDYSKGRVRYYQETDEMSVYFNKLLYMAHGDIEGFSSEYTSKPS